MSTDARALRAEKRSRASAGAEESTKDQPTEKTGETKRSRASADAEETTKDQPPEKTAKTGETKQSISVEADKEESAKDQPAGKPCYQYVIELEAKVAKLEKDYQGVCRIANEYEQGMNQAKQRVRLLEDLIDSKPNVNELKKANENMEKETKEKMAELQKKVSSLTLHLEAEKSRAKDDRMRDTLKINDLMGKMALLESDQQRILQKRLIEDMQKKLAETNKCLEATRLEALRREAELNCRLSSMLATTEELQRKLIRANNQRFISDQKIMELEQMLAQVEMALQQSGFALEVAQPRYPNHVARMPQATQLQLPQQQLLAGYPEEDDDAPALAIAEMPDLSDDGVS